MFSLTPKQSICRADLPIAILAVVLTLAISAHAQTYLVLHKFGGGADGWAPYAGLTMDRAGNFYGTTWVGGQSNQDCDWGCGVVFKLTRTQSNWTLDPIYTFQGPGAGDGSEPVARVTFGPDGALYGTTSYGGASNLGTVFRLTPGATACKTALCPWSENLLYSFQGGNIDGAMPGYGDVIFDAAGRLYGTTMLGVGSATSTAGLCTSLLAPAAVGANLSFISLLPHLSVNRMLESFWTIPAIFMAPPWEWEMPVPSMNSPLPKADGRKQPCSTSITGRNTRPSAACCWIAPEIFTARPRTVASDTEVQSSSFLPLVL